MGDFNANHFTEAVDIASADLGRPVVTVLGCRFVSDIVTVHLSAPTSNQGGCRDEVESELNWLQAQPPGLVILASSDHYWTDSTRLGDFANWAAGPDLNSLSTMASTKTDAFESALESTVTRLQQAGHEVLIVQTVPHFGVEPYLFEPTLCTTLMIQRGACVQSQHESAVETAQGLPRRAIERVSVSTGASVLDFRGYFCHGGVCNIERDGVLLYRDGHHISVGASVALAPDFAAAISAASSQ